MADDNFSIQNSLIKDLQQQNSSPVKDSTKLQSSQDSKINLFESYTPQPSKIKETIWTLDQLSALIKKSISGIGRVAVEGEVSKITPNRGHWYIDLSDGKNSLKCIMFQNNNRSMEWIPKQGEKIRVSGLMDCYAPHSTYSLKILRMEKSGVGDYALWRERLKVKLASQGLFSQDRKRPLPQFPRAIGVATSPTGAAIADILKVLHERYPIADVYIAPCIVQGERAAQSITNAIRLLNAHGKADILIVGRGGGSKESLRAFDEEIVVRAIANSNIPVICSVGHESDYSLADLAADVRAATPSHAAETAVPKQQVLLQKLQQQKIILDKEIKNKFLSCRSQLRSIHLEDPKLKVSKNKQALEQLKYQLQNNINDCLQKRAQKIQYCKEQIQKSDPTHTISLLQKKLEITHNQMETSIKKQMVQRRSDFLHSVSRLEDLNPLSILTRGYSIVQKNDSTNNDSPNCITNSKTLQKGDQVEIQFHEGKAKAKITSLIHKGDYEQASLFDIK